VQVLALLGTDQKSPFVGRTDAILLAFYHPRLSRASLLSIPPDLMVYIPGYTMQRLQIAFALGGIRQFNTTLEYNFGLRADHYALVHLDDFSRLVDDLHGVEMPVWTSYPDLCGGIPQGNTRLYGDQALCYIRFRLGEDEASRNNRQQEMLRQLMMTMVQNGNLVRIPELYTAYQQTVDSDLNLNDLLNFIPLALKLGDPNRIGFFSVETEALTPWNIPASTPAVSVFLPDTQKLLASAQEAVNFVLTPAPLSDRVLTYEAALTSSPSPTATLPATITLTPTIGPSPTRTLTNTPGPTLTPSLSPTAGPSPTRTLTPTPGDSPTPTNTVEGYPIS
jgi:LCP family protein required for cell wall assembly